MDRRGTHDAENLLVREKKLLRNSIMTRVLATAFIVGLAACSVAHEAHAQNAVPPANPKASTPAIANPNANNQGAPAPGEAQAKSRIEAAGYSNISGLIKDKDGVWRGKASKAGSTVNVGLDYQGNVVAR